MVERGMDADVVGDKGKARSAGDEGSVKNGEEAVWAVIVTKELWTKGICDDDAEDSDDEDDNAMDIKALIHKRAVKQKTRSGDNKMRKTIKSDKKKKKRKASEISTNFPALQLLHDPQSFSEKLYDILNRYDKRFSLDHKILIMQLLSRAVGAHKLTVLGFYTYVMKYLTYHQLRVPSILACLVQSIHDFTPPDAVTPVIRKLAQEFIHPGVGSEVIAAGLNSVREICRRQPWAMEEDLLNDLIEYRKSRDKAVTRGARGLLQLFRDVNPGMLKRRERGKTASMDMAQGRQPAPFGHGEHAAVDIEGLAMLEDHLKALREEEGVVSGDENESDGWDGWDVESNSSDSSSDSGGWVDVESDGDDNIVVSDSDDEADADAKAAKRASVAPEPDRISTLATTKILTPADFAMLNDLRLKAASKAVEAGGGTSAKRKLSELQGAQKSSSSAADEQTAVVGEEDILGPRKKTKADYEERMASIAKGREGREKFGSMKGKKNRETVSSTTNREKKRNKPIMMIMGSQGVRGKKKQSLREKQRRLRAHIDKAKKSYH
ncbi:hypothetical protein EWM64_g6967 [Hericium alpestre]|uniref:Protein SDA1 n=1 Tax=Hericium alpestre TaxID=135208 RepID=A0A4Y9ZR32_9AGAM|nr:hypothetical protein EWM64_g6967 [Hericium alpestre]